MFPDSPIAALNQHTCEAYRGHEFKWYLVVDKYQFHVYVAAVEQNVQNGLKVRMDWHQDSTLTFRPFAFDVMEQNLLIGTSDWFCRQCTIDRLWSVMGEYKLFAFNCRTLSYLILWYVMHFPHDQVYACFEKFHLMCGLDETQCLSFIEIHRYLAYKKENKKVSPCVLI